MKKEEKERLEKLIAEHTDPRKTEIQDEDPGVDYAEEYRKQTGKELSDGVNSDRYVIQ
jgi:hypothetical protein